MSSEILEIFPNQYPNREYQVTIECSEFTSLCPRTGQPDFGTIRVQYVPDQSIIELKSLKLYFFSFRDQGIFYESVVNKILDDLVAVARPIRCEVVGNFNIRGGITASVRSIFEQE